MLGYILSDKGEETMRIPIYSGCKHCQTLTGYANICDVCGVRLCGTETKSGKCNLHKLKQK